MPRFHHIAPEHKPHVARLQHVCEYFVQERARIEAELRYVLAAGGRAQNELVTFLQQVYGVDTTHPGVSVDADKGVVTEPTPDEAVAEPTADEPTALA